MNMEHCVILSLIAYTVSGRQALGGLSTWTSMQPLEGSMPCAS